MADETPKSDTQSPKWIVSPIYRVIHSNLFRYRLNAGEITLHFDTVTDSLPGSGSVTVPGGVTVISEVSVAMSWTQAKALMQTLEMTLATVEREIGPIVSPTPTQKASQDEQNKLITTLRSLYLRS
jgi:hypothetical protein